MVIGLLTLDLHFPGARSLKDKRQALRGPSGLQPREELRSVIAGDKFDRSKARSLLDSKTAAVQGQQVLFGDRLGGAGLVELHDHRVEQLLEPLAGDAADAQERDALRREVRGEFGRNAGRDSTGGLPIVRREERAR